ncbi:MAG: histidine kinase [Parvibaculaceae bacterium]
MTLRSRLILSISLVLILSVAAGGVLVYWHAAAKVHTELEAAIATGGRVALNALAGHDPASDPKERLRLVVADFDGDRHVKAQLLDDKQKPIAASTLLPPEEAAPQWFNRLLAEPSQVVHLRFPAIGAGYTLMLETDATNELSELWSDIILALQVLFLFFGLVLMLIYGMLGWALRPLQGLTAAFSRVGEGDYAARVPLPAISELARVADGFNRMTERLAGMEVQNRRLNDQLAEVQDEERAELARDLHDEIGPLLFAAGADGAMAERAIDTGKTGEAASRIGACREAIRQAQGHVRNILGRLRAPMVENLGLRQAVDDLVATWRARHPEVTFTVVLPPEGFGSALDRAIYRIVQESGNNALRHGRPGSIDILALQDAEGAVLVRVSDDGGGLRQTREAKGYGVIGMRERAEALGGSLAIENRAGGEGVVVSAQIPLHSGQPERNDMQRTAAR